MRFNWAFITIIVVYGFFLARYFYSFHKSLPDKYGLLVKNIISHVVLIVIIILMFILLRS